MAKLCLTKCVVAFLGSFVLMCGCSQTANDQTSSRTMGTKDLQPPEVSLTRPTSDGSTFKPAQGYVVAGSIKAAKVQWVPQQVIIKAAKDKEGKNEVDSFAIAPEKGIDDEHFSFSANRKAPNDEGRYFVWALVIGFEQEKASEDVRVLQTPTKQVVVEVQK